MMALVAGLDLGIGKLIFWLFNGSPRAEVGSRNVSQYDIEQDGAAEEVPAQADRRPPRRRLTRPRTR